MIKRKTVTCVKNLIQDWDSKAKQKLRSEKKDDNKTFNNKCYQRCSSSISMANAEFVPRDPPDLAEQFLHQMNICCA